MNKPRKTLGQIAYEAGGARTWDYVTWEGKPNWEKTGIAVAKEVLRRAKKKHQGYSHVYNLKLSDVK